MKKNIILILLLLILLTWCSIDLNDEKSNKINKLINENENLNQQVEKLKEKSKNDLFEKKLKCSNKITDITKILNDFNNKSENNEEIIEEIFYSPILDTCLYTSMHYVWNNILSYDIYNALTLKNLYNFSLLDYNDNYINDSLIYLQTVDKVRNQILKSKVDELKWE